jgi:uncharacterized protein YkwD
MRSNPARYAEHLERRLKYFEGKLFRLPNAVPLVTNEGSSAVREAIKILRSTPPLPLLKHSPGLTKAAQDHVRDQGPRGLTNHRGTDGSSPSERASRYATAKAYVAEVISFGPSQPRDVIVDLLIDDGVPDRGHRKILLDGSYRYAGSACGPHRTYGTMCVVDLAPQFTEAAKLKRQ